MSNFTQNQHEYWHDESHRDRRNPDHPVVVTYVKRKLAYIQKYIPLEGNILDIGAGNGYFTKHLNDLTPTTALDYSAVMLADNPVPKKLVMDARKLDLADNSFSVSFCHAVLHHIDPADRVQVVREMARVAKDYVVIIEPNRNNLLMAAFGALKAEEHGLLRFTTSYTKSLVEQVGLEVVHACSFGLITPNRMPIPKWLLPALTRLERPWPLVGITSIIIGKVK